MMQKDFVHNRANGFTLIEILVTLAIGTVILTGAVMSIYNVMVTTAQGKIQAVALNDVNRAAFAIKNDLLMAQTTDLSTSPQSSANLSWFDYTSSFGTAFQTDHYASYSLTGKTLRRIYDGTTSIVGRNVTSLIFSQNGKAVTVVISTNNSTVASKAETLKFTVHLRSEEVN